MEITTKLHKYQKEILKKLSTVPIRRFNQLLIEGFASEHMNYHLKKLIQLKMVEKNKEGYSLTDAGKHYFDRMDDERQKIEMPPKCSVIIRCVRKTDTGKVEHLMLKRTVQPYLGKVGPITGKIQFGESWTDAAHRELYEETGLTVETIALESIYRKIRNKEQGHTVQDVIFFIFFASGISGDMITKTPFQENFWATKEEILQMDTYDDLNVEDRLKPKPLKIAENIGIAVGY